MTIIKACLLYQCSNHFLENFWRRQQQE